MFVYITWLWRHFRSQKGTAIYCRILTGAVVLPGGLRQRQIKITKLFLLPLLSDIPHYITVCSACAIKCTSKAHWSLLRKGHFVLYSVVMWTYFDYEWELLRSSWREIYRLHNFIDVSHCHMYDMNNIHIRGCYFCTAEIRSPTQEYLVWTMQVE